MKTNVSTLLREFPKVRQAAMRGEEVIIVTREGNLRLSAVSQAGAQIIGARKQSLQCHDDKLDQPTVPEKQWKASL